MFLNSAVSLPLRAVSARPDRCVGTLVWDPNLGLSALMTLIGSITYSSLQKHIRISRYPPSTPHSSQPTTTTSTTLHNHTFTNFTIHIHHTTQTHILPLVSNIHCGIAMVPGTIRLPHYCAPLACIPHFSGGLAVWLLLLTNKQKASQIQSIQVNSIKWQSKTEWPQ